jgi:hypothetical protein
MEIIIVAALLALALCAFTLGRMRDNHLARKIGEEINKSNKDSQGFDNN